MACELITTPGAVFAPWGEPKCRHGQSARSALEAAAATCGHPVVYVTRVPVDAPAPNAQFRAKLDQMMPALLKVCSTYRVVSRKSALPRR